MRDLCQIAGVAVRVVIHGRHEVSVGGAVAPQPVRHQLPRLASLPLQKLAKEPFRRTGVTISLNQYVDHVPVLIPRAGLHSPPSIWTATRTTAPPGPPARTPSISISPRSSIPPTPSPCPTSSSIRAARGSTSRAQPHHPPGRDHPDGACRRWACATPPNHAPTLALPSPTPTLPPHSFRFRPKPHLPQGSAAS